VSWSLNDPLCWTSQATSESSDPPVAYGDIDSTAWGTTTIDDLGTTNNEVVHRLSPLASHAALSWRRGNVTAASCGVPIATATVLYGSAQGEETQHTTACRLCYHRHGCLIFSSLTPPQPIRQEGKKSRKYRHHGSMSCMVPTTETTRIYLNENRQGVVTCVHCDVKHTINMSNYTGDYLGEKSLKVKCSMCNKTFYIKFDLRKYHRININLAVRPNLEVNRRLR
jgi:hypothetical protein